MSNDNQLLAQRREKAESLAELEIPGSQGDGGALCRAYHAGLDFEDHIEWRHLFDRQLDTRSSITGGPLDQDLVDHTDDLAADLGQRR